MEGDTRPSWLFSFVSDSMQTDQFGRTRLVFPAHAGNNNAFVSHMCHPARRLGGAGCSSSNGHRTLLTDHARASSVVSDRLGKGGEITRATAVEPTDENEKT